VQAIAAVVFADFAYSSSCAFSSAHLRASQNLILRTF